MEAHLAPTRKAVAWHLAVSHELAQVLDVDLEELGGIGGGEDRGEIRRLGLGWGHAHILPLKAPLDRDS